jgi:hypothetical protein
MLSAMRLETTVVREPGEHPLPRNLAIPIPAPNHRPLTEYRFEVRSEADVRTLSRHRLPIHLLTAAKVSELGYPVSFPSQVVIARRFRPLVTTRLGTIPFVSSEAAASPRDEDAIVAMLRLDMLGARAIWDRNQDRLDPQYLLGRILEEKVERRAAFVRFSDVLPGIPTSSEALDPTRLESKLRKHPAPSPPR